VGRRAAFAASEAWECLGGPRRHRGDRVVSLQEGRYVVTILRVVGHDEENGLLAQLFMLCVDLSPLDYTEIDVVRPSLGEPTERKGSR
jgi:hypothetical protein